MARRSLGVSAAATTLLAVLGVLCSSPAAARAHRTSNAAVSRAAYRPIPVPYGFAGMNVDQPVWPNPEVDVSQQLDVMAQSGVDSVRAVIDWASAQPYSSWSQVPSDQSSQFVDVGGIPTDFTDADALVAGAAQHGMTLLPVIINAPSWDGQAIWHGSVEIPATPGPYAAFVKALVLRYGPNGSFWQANRQIPKDPIEMWQVWNEPNVYAFWSQPYIPSYIALLKATHDAIKQADPRAKVVLGGLPNYSWIDLKRIEAHGGRGLFDVVDVHPYTRLPVGVLTILWYVRRVLNHSGGAHVPMIAGEISWPSSLGKGAQSVGFDIATTEAGQAKDVGQMLPILARNRRRLGLAGFYYYDWAGLERAGAEAFDFAGLFKYSTSNFHFYAKPAYYVFRSDALWMEGCRSKAVLATQCVH